MKEYSPKNIRLVSGVAACALSRRSFLSAAGAAALTVPLAACGPASPPPPGSANSKPIEGGNLSYQLASDPRSLDLAASANAVNAIVGWNIFEHLFERDRNLEPKPGLVDTYTKSDDGLTYTFVLRKGVTFQDGSPLTATDVVASLNRWLKVAPLGRVAAPSFARMTAPDDLTFEIKLNQRRYNLEGELATSGTEIQKQSILANVGPGGIDRNEVIGTGPYRLESWGAQQLVLRRYQGYRSRAEDWGGNAGAKHAYADTITFHFVADDNAIMSGLQTGLWDIARPTTDQFDAIKGDSNLGVDFLPGANINTLVFNRNPASVFSNLKARQALNLAVNKPELIAATGGDTGVVVPESAFYPKDRSDLYSAAGRDIYDQHDLRRAKELFAEAGVRDGDTIRIVTTGTFPQIYQWAVLIQDQLQQIGIKASVRSYDYVSLLGFIMQEPTSWDLTMNLMTGTSTPSPATMSTVNLPWMAEQPAELRTLLAEYQNSAGADQARAAVDRTQKFFWNDMTALVFAHTRVWVARSSRTQGEIFDGNYANVWVDRG